MSGGSLQLQRYLSARRRGATMMTACAESAISLGEARLIEADIARDPSLLAPLAELASPPSPPIPAPVEAPTQGDGPMARGKKKDTPISGEIPKPDFDLADKIYNEDIAPANTAQKRAMKEASDGWKAIKGDARVHVGGARTAYKLARMESAEQQAWLRSFHGVMVKLGITLHADLADVAEGRSEDTNVVPIGTPAAPSLATVPGPEGDDEHDDGELPEAAE